MRRRAPRPVAQAVERLVGRLAPATLLAEVQRAWPAAAGELIAAEAEPVAERDGTVTLACRSATWAQELDLMSPTLVARLNEVLGRPAVRAIRCRATAGARRSP